MATHSKNKKGSDLKKLLWKHKLPFALILLFTILTVDYFDKRYTFNGALSSLISSIVLLSIVLSFPIAIAIRRYGWGFGIAVVLFTFLYILSGVIFCNAISPLECTLLP
jgi:hypothetical protein